MGSGAEAERAVECMVTLNWLPGPEWLHTGCTEGKGWMKGKLATVSAVAARVSIGRSFRKICPPTCALASFCLVG